MVRTGLAPDRGPGLSETEAMRSAQRLDIATVRNTAVAGDPPIAGIWMARQPPGRSAAAQTGSRSQMRRHPLQDRVRHDDVDRLGLGLPLLDKAEAEPQPARLGERLRLPDHLRGGVDAVHVRLRPALGER